MMRKTSGAFFVTLLFVVSSLWAQSAEADGMAVLCRNKKTVRTLRVEKQKDGYITLYTKAGVDREVGRGQSLVSNKNILGNIRTNLEGAGWKCQDLQNFSVLESPAQ
jgi:hypothetical protein